MYMIHEQIIPRHHCMYVLILVVEEKFHQDNENRVGITTTVTLNGVGFWKWFNLKNCLLKMLYIIPGKHVCSMSMYLAGII